MHAVRFRIPYSLGLLAVFFCAVAVLSVGAADDAEWLRELPVSKSHQRKCQKLNRSGHRLTQVREFSAT